MSKLKRTTSEADYIAAGATARSRMCSKILTQLSDDVVCSAMNRIKLNLKALELTSLAKASVPASLGD